MLTKEQEKEIDAIELSEENRQIAKYLARNHNQMTPIFIHGSTVIASLSDAELEYYLSRFKKESAE